MRLARDRLEIGYRLDRQWHHLRGEMEGSKRRTLEALIATLEATGVPYAIIGGVAVQLHREEPRTTLDIDVAVLDLASLPRRELEEASFARTGTFEHSENWRGPDGTPVQFTDDARLHEAVREAESRETGAGPVRVVSRLHLLRSKLLAASDPARRKSKRLMDLADAHALMEASPELRDRLTPSEQDVLDSTGPM